MKRLNLIARKVINAMEAMGEFKIQASGGIAIFMVACTLYVVMDGTINILIHIFK